MVKIGGLQIPRLTLLVIAIDSALIMLAVLAASACTFLLLRSGGGGLFDSQMLVRLALVVLVCHIALYYNELYDLSPARRRSETFVRLLQAFGTAWLVLAVWHYAKPSLRPERTIAGLALPLVLLLVLAWRLTLAHTDIFLKRSDKVLVVGTGEAGISLVREILQRPGLNLKVIGFLDENDENIGKPLVNPGIVGGLSDLENFVAKEKVNRIILSLAERRGRTPLRQLIRLKFSGVQVEDAHAFYERITGRILLDNLPPSSLIFADGFRKSHWLLATKRAMDLVLSFSALLVSLPLMAAVAAAVWLETGSPILFRQVRVGFGGRHFEMLKFRSMYQDAEANGPCWATRDDARVTRVGRFIRKYRLDELPQLFNVLRGVMSLVGPRPERPQFCTLLGREIPLFAERHSVPPGISGWAQIKYPYASSVEEAKRKLEFDLYYIKHLSVLMDLAIILETSKVMLFGRGGR